MKSKPFTYRGFLDSIEKKGSSVLTEKAEQIVEHFRPNKLFAAHFAPATFLLDYTSRKYLYIDNGFFSVHGYSTEWFYEAGLEQYLARYHPLDFDVNNTRIFPDNIAFIKAVPLTRYADYIFSYNYRIKNSEGTYFTVLQRSSYIPGSLPGEPAGAIGVAFDISHFKNDLSIIHTIEEVIQTEDGVVRRTVFKKVHPVSDENVASLSNREVEVLRLMADGISSKQIAAQLHLSAYTIHNHRKNMLAKTGCKSPAELINFAMKHGFI